MATPMVRDDRIRISSLGEWYDDLLTIDAAISSSTPGAKGASLLCSALQQRESRIKERVRYLAAKRGLTFEDMWLQLLNGTYEKFTKEELQALEAIAPFTEQV